MPGLLTRETKCCNTENYTNGSREKERSCGIGEKEMSAIYEPGVITNK